MLIHSEMLQPNITLGFHSSLCDKDDIRLDPLGSPGGLHLDNHHVSWVNPW